ncbi:MULTISPECIES: hypothetical protein [Bacillaceae]|uniref:hypothetical protein n=1 Tax=Bacillaceae TaxID=186817 RepID=UPI000BFE784A|nr:MULTISPECIES: hypothetical protein [Bacillaceae]MCM3164332.1 hypothetical protein [Metabacillus litoralis]PGT75196.1 hypothetical protein COD11_26120 [Bacillus sp. AFS040349]UGB33727.1 hypothetical protein LPC09_26090 [Metabacillus sp. B2-18]
MTKQSNFPLAMTNMGEPSEMSPIKEITYEDTGSPIIEVTQPLTSKEPLEIRKPSSVTLI